jgi:hypothetical protein
MENNANFIGFINFINKEVLNVVDVKGNYVKIEPKTKDYLNKRGKKKGTTHIFTLKDSRIVGESPVIFNITVLDAGNVYLYINKQKQAGEKDNSFVAFKYRFFLDVVNFVEENKANFKFTANSKEQCLEQYIPDNVKKLGLEENKIYYRTKFNKGEKKC